MLDNGYYVIGHFDEYYVSCKEVYKKQHFDHDYLLYGYDDSKSGFLSIGYTGTFTKYEEFVIKYNEFYDASKYVPVEKLNINLLKPKTQFNYNIDIRSIREQLKEYLDSESKFFNNYDKRIYGYNAVKRLCDRIENEIKTNSDIDLRGVRALYELKNFMYMRIIYLNDNGYIKISDNRVKEYGDYVSFLKSFFKMCIEYNSREKDNITDDHLKELRFILSKEYEYLKTIYSLVN